ncbi:MAG TPA: histidine kinase [Gemmatimonadales bacterium]
MRYGFAVLSTAIALALTHAFVPVAGQSVFLFFFTAVVSSAWYGGLGPGLLTTVLSVLAAGFFFVPPIHTLSLNHRGEQLALAIFATLAVVASSLSASLRAATRRAESLAGQLEIRAHEAERARARAVRASQLEAQLGQARLDALRAQLNPHFLFNTLNTIAMLVRRNANSEALGGIVGLGELLRQVLDRRGTAEVPLAHELAMVERYLDIERLRFRDRLSVALAVEDDALDALVPTMLLQPLVENAVRHGVARKSGPGRVEIAARSRNGRLTIEVRDDGPGFPAGWRERPAPGVGIANTRERLRQLFGDGQRFAVSNGCGGGAVVSLELPHQTADSGDGAPRGPRRSGRPALRAAPRGAR